MSMCSWARAQRGALAECMSSYDRSRRRLRVCNGRRCFVSESYRDNACYDIVQARQHDEEELARKSQRRGQSAVGFRSEKDTFVSRQAC